MCRTWRLKYAKHCQGNLKISINGGIQVEGFALPNFNTYYKAMLNKKSMTLKLK